MPTGPLSQCPRSTHYGYSVGLVLVYVLRLTSRADLPSSCRSVPVKKAPCLWGAEGRPGLYRAILRVTHRAILGRVLRTL